MGPLSPDGRYLTALRQPQSAQTASLLIVPVDRDQPRELLQLTQPDRFIGRRQAREVWTPDSTAVIFLKDTGSHLEFWMAPIAGGRPRKLDINADLLKGGTVEDQGFSLSPNGGSIAFVMGKSSDEVWALENFLPPQIKPGAQR